ncbi:MAG: HRDC domain-containing protein [Gammaproteobacteria bacterium]|nr:HRDC domain-containing protein [Gammaproteobacteria bacterium]
MPHTTALPIVATPEALRQLIDNASQQTVLALDTEFFWERTYYPVLGIIQLGWSAEESYLIDAVALTDLTPLAVLLNNPRICKILHDAPQDLTIIERATAATPRNIFDTRLAAGFTGRSATLSLANLLAELLDVHLAKTETRTDWLHRPLSVKQVDYALDDIRYLPALRQKLEEEVKQRGHGDKLQQELSRLDDLSYNHQPDTSHLFLKIKGAQQLTPAALAVLRQLAIWRDSEARRLDIPRRHLISDDRLLQLAAEQPQEAAAIAQIIDNNRRHLHHADEALLELIAKAQNEPASAWPTPQTIPESAVRQRVKTLTAALASHCQSLGIDPMLVANRSELTHLVENRSSSTRLHDNSWRTPIINSLLHTIGPAANAKE